MIAAMRFKNVYPFSAIVGQEKMKKALILNLINPRDWRGSDQRGKRDRQVNGGPGAGSFDAGTESRKELSLSLQSNG